ncbi:MAG: hypothetical protein Q4615_04700 [Paracoccus aminovorans]|nr:hypothetical protein [Paracoccus aminovorans]
MDLESRTYFDPATGEIIRAMRSDADTLALNAPPGAEYVEGIWSGQEYVIVGGVPVLRPPPAPDPGAAIEAARAAAVMPRPDFLLAAIAAGIIQPSDAGPAARGEIPPSLASVFEGLPPEVQLEAVVRWGAATMIERMNPILLALADAMDVGEAQLDGLFGI